MAARIRTVSIEVLNDFIACRRPLAVVSRTTLCRKRDTLLYAVIIIL